MTVLHPAIAELGAVASASITPVAVAIGRKPGASVGTGPEWPERLALDAGEHYRFGFSMSACIGCHSCEVACAEQNGLPAGTTWRRVGEIEGGDHPTTRRFHLSMSCNHCLEPACLEGCPTNAYEKLTNGIVVHHAQDCIGCQYCTWNCPYSVPAFQPDRRIVTKCDMCRPRLDAGMEPACASACPTQAITIERFRPDEWRADHSAADAPELPDSSITLSTTRIELPADLPERIYAASDWNLRPEHPHWPLVWLTLISQLAVGLSLFATTTSARIVAAGFAGVGLLGALGHLGRPLMAYKALRNLRRSWLSREVLALSIYAWLAGAAVIVPGLANGARFAGLLGVFASARLYVVPGRPAWNTPLTIVRFFATVVALGGFAIGAPGAGAAGLATAVGATALNWWRLAGDERLPWRGSVRLELRRFRSWTIVRLFVAIGAVWLGFAGFSVAAVALAAVTEGVARWLFFVTVVPLNVPGAFWRGAAGSHR